MKSRATDAQKIMGVLPQMFTSEDLERLDRELYWGLSVIDDKPTDIKGLQRAEGGLGYVIGGTDTTVELGKNVTEHDNFGPEPLPSNELPATCESGNDKTETSHAVSNSPPADSEDEDGWWHGEDEF